MEHLTKDEKRVMRSTANAAKRCENLLRRNLTFHRPDLEELREKYNLLEFV